MGRGRSGPPATTQLLPGPRLRPPTHLRWPTPKPWGQPAGGTGRSEDSEESGPGGGGGEFPPTPAWACSPPPPPPGGGAPLGEFHRAAMARASLGWGGPREKSGKRRGTGWDQARSCLLLQTPAASACPRLSVHHSCLFRGCGGREWHFHRQAGGVGTCERKSVRIGKRVYACAFDHEWLTGSACVHFIQGCL